MDPEDYFETGNEAQEGAYEAIKELEYLKREMQRIRSKMFITECDAIDKLVRSNRGDLLKLNIPAIKAAHRRNRR